MKEHTITTSVDTELRDRFDETVNWRHSNRAETLRKAMRLWCITDNPEDALQREKDAQASPDDETAEA
jgi:metal-responsive CopG/Arc/MetJ family transcriptional regulator